MDLKRLGWSLGRPLRGPVRRHIEHEVERALRNRVGRVPMTQFDPEDVFIIGYPKSGTTWVQNLIAGVVYGLDPEYAPDSVVQELVPGMIRRYYHRYRTPMFIKTHKYPRPEYKRVVYIIRDGRDVLVSNYHFLQGFDMDVDLMRMAREGDERSPGRWHEHVEAWLANPHGADMIVIRYEDLHADGVKELRKFCDFVGVERSDDYLGNLVDKASFANIRKKEAQYGRDLQGWPQDRFFARRGKVGSYKDEMPLEVLKAFEADAGATLERCGYQLEREGVKSP